MSMHLYYLKTGVRLYRTSLGVSAAQQVLSWKNAGFAKWESSVWSVIVDTRCR